jgi:hypothetical protein
MTHGIGRSNKPSRQLFTFNLRNTYPFLFYTSNDILCNRLKYNTNRSSCLNVKTFLSYRYALLFSPIRKCYDVNEEINQNL